MKFKSEISKIEEELPKRTFDSSNLEKIINKGLEIAQNLSQAWLRAGYLNKQRLQYLLFPGGILYNKEERRVRTQKINPVFAGIPLLTRVLEEKKKGNSIKNCLKSHCVDPYGFEP